MKNDRILLLGPQGAGKTFLTKELRKEGYDIADGDEIPHLAQVFDSTGKVIERPKEPPPLEWWETHKIRWNKEWIREFIKERPQIVMFNVISEDLLGFSDIFDRMYYLEVKPDLWWDRIAKRQPELYGRMTDKEKKAMLNYYAKQAELAKKHNIEIVDMNGSKEENFIQVKRIIDQKR